MEVTETVHLSARAAWRAWLKKHHASKREIWLVFFKKNSGKPRIPYADAVEEALCFGWIDSIVKPIDRHSYAQRFTPRKSGSNWSLPNLIRVKRLIAEGQMTPAGARQLPSRRAAVAFKARHHQRRTAPTSAPRDFAAALRRNARASALWEVLAPGYRRLYVRWIIEAKLAATRELRIRKAVNKLARGAKHPMQVIDRL